MRRKIIPIALLVILTLIIAGVLLFETREQTKLKMGTFVRIVLHGERWLDFDNAFKKAFDAIDKIDKTANVYDPDSELSRLNQKACVEPIAVSNELFALIDYSLKLSDETDGIFDATAFPLVELWKRYQNGGQAPSTDEIDKALSFVGYKFIKLDESQKTVFFGKKGLALDLSAIAKGFAADRAIVELEKCGFKSAVVNAGGDLYCLGRKYFLMKWKIGIMDPADNKRIESILYLTDKAAATSGGYEQHFTYEGKEYTHIINTKTGYPKEVRFSSVTVIASACMIADGIATAVLAGGKNVKKEIQESYPGIDIIVKD
ncbi:MAG: FAD:protein FMN transferase [Candidatus Omnitrophota bacterium]